MDSLPNAAIPEGSQPSTTLAASISPRGSFCSTANCPGSHWESASDPLWALLQRLDPLQGGMEGPWDSPLEGQAQHKAAAAGDVTNITHNQPSEEGPGGCRSSWLLTLRTQGWGFPPGWGCGPRSAPAGPWTSPVSTALAPLAVTCAPSPAAHKPPTAP